MATQSPCDLVQIKYKGDGKQTLFTFPFIYIHPLDVNVSLWDNTTKDYVVIPRDKWSFANATTVQLQDPPQVPPPKQHPSDPDIFNLKISRLTDIVTPEAEFYPGSAIRAEDLNNNFEQLRFAIQEGRCEVIGQITHLISDVAWNKFSLNNRAKIGDTIFEQDQKEGRWTRGLNDRYIATSDAIGARLDPYVQDTIPAPVPLPGAEQDGKTWFDTQDLVQRFWDAKAQAWVTLANSGPQGLPYQTMVSATQPLTRNDGSPIQNGDAWFNTSSATLFINYQDGDSTQWVSTSKAGPPGPVGPAGPAGPPGPIAPGNGVGINAAKQIIVIDDGTF